MCLFFSNYLNVFTEPQKQKPQGIGKLFSQIVINTTGTKPDFNLEEKASIDKDTRELRQIIREMADYLPREDPEKGKENLHYFSLTLLCNAKTRRSMENHTFGHL